MTSELEKQFFDTFGIQPNKEIFWCENDNKICECKYDCDEICRTRKIEYPQITDRILLELISICVLYGWHLCRYWNGNQDFVYENQRLKPEERFCVIDTDLKNATLILLIELANKEGVKHQVRTLF